MKSKIYNKIIKGISNAVKLSINESLFDDNTFIDDNPYIDNVKNDYLKEIKNKINSNINLSKEEREFIWSVTDEYSPKSNRALKGLIANCFQNKIANLNFIDTSHVTDMSNLFFDEYVISGDETHFIGDTINLDISEWNVSNVTDMSYMFYGQILFNSDLSKWDVSNVTDMSGMFESCEEFLSDLSKWNVSKVTDMNNMFYGCEKFNSDLSKWNVSHVENMTRMFMECRKFNSDLSLWNTSNVVSMTDMFHNAFKFKSDLSKWNVSRCEDYYGFTTNVIIAKKYLPKFH